MNSLRLAVFSFLLFLPGMLPAAAQELSLSEEMITRYLSVYERIIASSPEAAFRIFHNESIEPGTPEAAMADAALKQAGFATAQEFAAVDVVIGTAWLQLTAQEMAETAVTKKREAVELLEDALGDPNIKDAQRAELEKALEQMQREEQPAGIASDADLIDQAGMDLMRSYRERLKPVMTMESGTPLREF